MISYQTIRQTNALDVYGTYLSFSLTSKVPLVCVFLSAACMMFFLTIVAASIWPQAAIVLCALAGMICTLQYLIYGVHSVLCFLGRVGRGIRKATLRIGVVVFRRSSIVPGGGEAAEQDEVLRDHASTSPPRANSLNAPPRPPRNPARNPTRQTSI